MKIGIITQPLLNNYGGVLQNFALQKVLLNMGNEPITIDYIPQKPKWKVPLSFVKKVLHSVEKRSSISDGKHLSFRREMFECFVQDNIKKTPIVKKIGRDLIKKISVNAVVVGSDQVWRPMYNYYIKNMFLDFCKKCAGIKRIAYAASFGVDEWEYSKLQTKVCSELAKKFDAISVREESAVKMCKEYLNVGATWVLDPTLLLNAEDYSSICKNIPKSQEKYIAVYALDIKDSIREYCDKVAEERNLTIKIFMVDDDATLSIPEWLAMFRDASYVVTDSFHGTVFSIIFGKKFKCFYNKDRGAARFESLMNMYNSGKLEEMRSFSLNWLKNALEK